MIGFSDHKEWRFDNQEDHEERTLGISRASTRAMVLSSIHINHCTALPIKINRPGWTVMIEISLDL